MPRLYKLAESAIKGKLVRAAVDLLPGTNVIKEPPVLHVPNSDVNDNRNLELEKTTGIPSYYWAAYDAYKGLRPDHQREYGSLYGPTDIEALQGYRAMLDHQVNRHNLSLDVEEFLHIGMILRLNACRDEDGFGTYPLGTRLNHSCIPNCCWEFDSMNSKERVIRTIAPVQQGEELTITYNCEHSLNPTHERRGKYLRSKDFLCECAQCTSPADLARRFLCCTGRCPGHHSVCQTLDTDPPYLLPCSACGTAPDDDFQVHMFRLEAAELAKIPTPSGSSSGFAGRLFSIFGSSRTTRPAVVADSLEPVPLPLHYSAAYFLRLKIEAAVKSPGGAERTVQFVRQYLRLYATLLPYPCRLLFEAQLYAASVLAEVGSAESLQLASIAYDKARHNIMISGGVERHGVDQLVDLPQREAVARLQALQTGNIVMHSINTHT